LALAVCVDADLDPDVIVVLSDKIKISKCNALLFGWYFLYMTKSKCIVLYCKNAKWYWDKNFPYFNLSLPLHLVHFLKRFGYKRLDGQND